MSTDDRFATPLYMETAWAAFARMLQDAARTDECYRCPENPDGRIDTLEPDPGLCRACLDELSHANECARIEAAWGALGDDPLDEEWTA